MSAAVALAFARLLGFAFRAPGFSHPSVPPPLRVGFALVLAFTLAPTLHLARQPASAAFACGIVTEFLIGAAIGFGAGVLYDGAYAGGRVIDDYVGIRSISPDAALFMSSGYGRIWSLAMTGGFFVLGGYRIVLLALARSFVAIPPETLGTLTDWHTFALALPEAVFSSALLVAAPSIALAFAVQVAIGALSRAIPRLATLSLSFPLAFAAALIGTAVALPRLYALAAHPWLLMPFLSR